MGLQTSPESPAAVRTVSHLLAQWIDRLGSIWIEGQIAQISRRPGMRMAWVTLRDTDADLSLSVVTDVALLGATQPPLTEGQRVIVHGKPEFYEGRGSLQIRAREFRAVGRGALLEEIERLRALFEAEGLFAAARKRPLPFLPRRVGLISGRASDALIDVRENAERRWPAVRFEVREVAVQGASAVTSIVRALEELNDVPHVDVIVIARGGGSVEDLLPFSNERLVRAVAASRIPVVSAIGHEKDVPLVDLVADLRASTPTDAAKRIVPDLAEETALIAGARERTRRAVARRITAEAESIDRQRATMRRHLTQRIDHGRHDLEHLVARLTALSPAATLDRGYAVVRTLEGQVVRDVAEVSAGDHLGVRVAQGGFTVRVEDLG